MMNVFKNGRLIHNLANSSLSSICWPAGLAIGKGQNPLPMFVPFKGHHEPLLDPYETASALFAAIPQAASQTQDHWPYLWSKFKDIIIQFYDALEVHSQANGISRRSQNMLEQMIVQHNVKQHHPLTIGRTHGVFIDVGQAIHDISAPASAERLMALVTVDEDDLGVIMLPLFDGFISKHELIEVIANKFYWIILGKFFKRTLYHQLHTKRTLSGATLWRSNTLLAQGVFTNFQEQFHDYAGWTLFLQELWKRPSWTESQFYDATIEEEPGETRFVENGQITIEVSQPIPTIKTNVEQLTISVQVAGTSAGVVTVPVVDTAVAAQAIRAAITERCGLELMRIAVREGIVGQSLTDHHTLQARLDSASTKYKRNQSAAGQTSGQEFNPKYAESDYDPNKSEKYFEDLYHKRRDPWHYSSPYEQIKYAQALSLLPHKSFAHGLEIGCAEGHFTTQLATYTQNLLATDISNEALKRAADRCAGLDHVTFQQMDLRKAQLPDAQDLIVCSEILYFMDNETVLQQVAANISGALKEGGYLLTTHANLIVDDPNSSGFNWKHPFGGKKIGEIFALTTELKLVKEIQTPLYRVQLFQRKAQKRFKLWSAKPKTINYDYQPTVIPAHFSRYVCWQGADPFNRPPVNTNRLPILMYHRVAPTGADALSRYRVTPQAFADQLRYLRESGYYTVSFETWQEAAKNKKPLPGKAICLTFDDGYLDFYTYAFPLLKKYNLTATVFIVTERVGQSNIWDAQYGEEVPLMNWEQIAELNEQGIGLGSHTATHPHLTTLSPTDIAWEVKSSQAVLSEKLNKQITSIAYPYGNTDELVQHIISRVGYLYAVTTRQAFCEFSTSLTAMPRLEIMGSDTIADFARKIAGAHSR